jgi:hypothetical protein
VMSTPTHAEVPVRSVPAERELLGVSGGRSVRGGGWVQARVCVQRQATRGGAT